MEIRLSGHSAYRTEYHLVWIPKYCRRILNPGLRGYLRKLFPKIMKSLPGCEIIECSIQIDHIHMVMIIPPRYPVSEVIGKIKCQTTSKLRKKFSWLSKGILERKHRLVTRILCLYYRFGRKEHYRIRKMATEPGFRSSEA